MEKPLLQLDNLANAFYLEGFALHNINGYKILRQNWEVIYKMCQDTNAAWANYNISEGICSKTENANEYLYTIGNKYIGRHYSGSLGDVSIYKGGVKHTINDGGTGLSYCYFPNILNTQNGNLLYTTDKYLDRGVYGTHKTGTETLKIIDNAGRDLSALNGKTVHNLRDGSTATITSVTTTTATNDTLNFTGGFSDAGSIAAGDEWVVFVDAWQDLTAGLTYPHFAGQLAYYQWSRQIIDFDGDYFIGNGNYIAKLNNDESTFDNDFTRLTRFAQFRCMARNNAYILIGADKYSAGVLLLWNGTTQNKYLSELTLPYNIKSIKPYGAGWIVVAGSTLYYTDGYSVKELSVVPDTDGDTDLTLSPNGMAVINEKVILNIGSGFSNRSRPGAHIYDLQNDAWSYSPFMDINARKCFSGTWAGLTAWIANKLIISYKTDGEKNTLGEIDIDGSSMSQLIFYFSPSAKTVINRIELILGRDLRDYINEALNATATLAIANGNAQLWSQIQTNAAATAANEIKVDGSLSTHAGEVGNMVRILGGTTASGQIAFISSIANAGTNTETWTLDRNLSGNVAGGINIQVMPFRKMGEYALTAKTLKNPYVFDKGIEGADFFVLVHIGGSNIEIRNINIY